jgi:hypothetical protein
MVLNHSGGFKSVPKAIMMALDKPYGWVSKSWGTKKKKNKGWREFDAALILDATHCVDSKNIIYVFIGPLWWSASCPACQTILLRTALYSTMPRATVEQ